VVHALQRLAVAGAIGDSTGAVTTDVVEGMDFAVAITSDDEWFIHHTTGEVITGQFELFKSADQLPCFGKISSFSCASSAGSRYQSEGMVVALAKSGSNINGVAI